MQEKYEGEEDVQDEQYIEDVFSIITKYFKIYLK